MAGVGSGFRREPVLGWVSKRTEAVLDDDVLGERLGLIEFEPLRMATRRRGGFFSCLENGTSSMQAIY